MNIEINGLQRGDKKIFEKIVTAYWPRLLHFATIYIMEKDVAKELVQDTFMSLWNSRKELNDDSCLISFLMVVCRNKCLNYLKSLRLETIAISELTEQDIYRRSSLCALEDDALDMLISGELHQAIEDSLNKLPVRTREIFIKSRYEGLKNREIAETEEITIKAVEFHITKALKQLRCDLSPEYFTLFLYMIAHFFTEK